MKVAIQEGDLATIKQMIEEEAFNIEEILDEENNYSLLLYTVAHKQSQLVGYLAKQGCDTLRKDKAGLTCLHLAVQVGSLDTLKALLGCGVSLDLIDEQVRTVFDMEVTQDDIKSFLD